MSKYRIAIDLTTKTIDKRAKYFRNLIMTFIFIIAGSILLVIITKQYYVSFILLFLIPTCGLFFFYDNKLINQWRSQLFQSWIKKEVDIKNFCEAVNSISILPKQTLKGMLATLPPSDDIIKELRMGSATREAISIAIMAIHKYRTDLIALKTFYSAIATTALVTTLMFANWYPLLGFALIPTYPLLQRWLKHKRLRSASKQIAAMQSAEEFDHQAYLELVTAFDWTPISQSEKTKFLAKDTPNISPEFS